MNKEKMIDITPEELEDADFRHGIYVLFIAVLLFCFLGPHIALAFCFTGIIVILIRNVVLDDWVWS